MNYRAAKARMLAICAADLRSHEGTELTLCDPHALEGGSDTDCPDCARFRRALMEIADELEARGRGREGREA